MSSRYLKDLEKRRSKIIHIYRNGDPYSRATFVILRLPEQVELERIIKAIEEKVKLPLNRPIRKLFEMNGALVESPAQIEDGKYYVAASAENYNSMSYGHPSNWVLVGPVRTNKYANVHFTTRAEEEGSPKKLSSSNNILSLDKPKSRSFNTKSDQSKINKIQKKSTSTKKYTKKDMCASEHVDQILNDRDAVETKSMDGDIEFQPEKIDSNEGDEKPKEPYNTHPVTQEPNEKPFDNETQEHIKIDSVIDHQEDSLVENVNKVSEENNLVTNENSSHKIEQEKHENLGEEEKIANENLTNPEVIAEENIPKDNLSNPAETNSDTLNDAPPDLQKTEEISLHNQEIVDEVSSKEDPITQTEQDDSLDHEENDEASVNAATRIQATYRGYRVRSEMSKGNNELSQESIEENTDTSEAPTNTD